MQKFKIVSNTSSAQDNWEDICQWLSNDFCEVNKIIIQNLESPISLISELASYIILSGGKRIRPLLTIASAKLCEYKGERHLNLAASIEFIHTATLLHDDVIDESEKRRGKTTANIVWNNKSSILVGDYLLSKAFGLMIKDGSNKCLKTISDASIKISQGEVLQLQRSSRIDTTESQYLEIVESKTAALFSAACSVSGIITQVSFDKEKALEEYGKFIGMSFQIIDDALDYDSKNNLLDKNAGDDFREGKVSLPIILAYKRSTDLEKRFIERVINPANQKEEHFYEVTNIINKYNIIEDCFNKAKHFTIMAKDALSPFKNNYNKEKLICIAEIVLGRNI